MRQCSRGQRSIWSSTRDADALRALNFLIGEMKRWRPLSEEQGCDARK